MPLEKQQQLAGDIIVSGLILTMILGGYLGAPPYQAFDYGMDHALGYGLGIYISALPDAVALAWMIAYACRTNEKMSIYWPVFIATIFLFVGLTTLIQLRLYPLMPLEWLVVVVIARLFAFFGTALLWAIPFQLRAVKNARGKPQVPGFPSEENERGVGPT